MRAMILAAGRGERLRPVTDLLPKALVEVAGESLLERHLRSLSGSGVTHAVINLDWLGDMICKRIGDGHRFGLSVCYSPEFGNVLETAGGILRALPMLGEEPFCVVNADVFTDAIPALCDVRLADSDLGHLLMVPKPDFKPNGDFDLSNGRLRNDTTPDYTFSGMAIYRPQFFASLAPGRSPLAPLLRRAADNDRLAASLHEGIWEDVGTPERLERVRESYVG